MFTLAERWNRHRLDEWFPTLVRYIGVALMVYAAFIDKGANPALIPTALGMILFKTVYNGGPPKGGE